MNKLLQFILGVVSCVLLITTISLFIKHSSSIEEVEHLNNDNSKLESENSKLKSENSDLIQENNDLENEISKLNNQLSNAKRFNNIVNNRLTYGSAPTRTFTGNAMETKIDGEFNGWDGETIFKMRNGTIWQQASYSYKYRYAYSPDVLIYSKDGSTYMRVEGMDDEIRVKRLK
ncbi:hypothetical protein [Chishuiella sp.]|uniref:hypothetical protein n=1 Tax=Chishuiella sp. TaxID=1969467 RepID=UPI0028AAD6D3|nr:hypothetical protein [Chishuiella sp.]